jgi:cobalt/nickel transport system permease protein
VNTRATTPEWLLTAEAGLCPCGCSGRRTKRSFVEKTIAGTVGVLRHAMFSEDTAGRPGFLQRVQPRVKLLTVLGLLVTAALVRRIPVLLGMYAGTSLLAFASRVSLAFFVKRVWLFVPLFTGLVVLPATFSFITAGHIVVPFGTWFGHRVGMTGQGLLAAGLIVMRVTVSISLVLLLTLTTPWNRLLAALRALLVPKMFVLVLAMAYRYVFHLLGAVTDMYTARKARTIDADTDAVAGRRFVAASAATLFAKSHALAEEVHMAMLARGYTGDVRTLASERVAIRDVAWILACAATAFLILGGDRVLGR